MPVISFVSEKGGVGKTTALYHVGEGLRRFHNKKVLFLDTDYQRGGLTCRLLPEMVENFRLGEVTDTTLYHAYQYLYSGQMALPKLTVRSTNSGLDIVPADPRLNAISVDKMPPANNIRDNNKMLIRHLTLIKDCLVDLDSEYDYILIDSHPDLYDLEKAVMFASEFCLSPVKLDAQSSIGVPSTVQAILDVDEDVAAVGPLVGLEGYSGTVFLGAIGMMCREYGNALKYSEQTIYNRLKRTSGIFDAYVTEGDGIRQAAEQGCSVYDLGGANSEKQAQHFKSVVDELLGMLP